MGRFAINPFTEVVVTEKAMGTFSIALRALLYAIVGAPLLAWIISRIRALDPWLGVFLPAWAQMPGVVLTIAAGLLLVRAFEMFVVQGRGTPLVIDPPKEFVGVGPYKYVRNPIYAGQVTLLVGLGLYLRSLSVLIFAVLWFGVVHLFVVYYEEPGLNKRFGPAYEDYRRSVPRWIPRLGRARRP